MGSKGNQTRELIKDAAYVLFAKKGFKEVTMKDICEATGLSRGGLYRYFGSTAEIFAEIWDGLTDNLWNTLDRRMAEEQSARDILKDVLELRKREIEDKENSLSLSIYEYSHSVNKELFVELNHQSKMIWSRFIQYGIARGEFQTVNVEEVVDLILYSYQGARMWSSILVMDQGVSRHLTDCIWKLLISDERSTQE